MIFSDNLCVFSVQKFKQKGREEQCEPDAPSQAKKVATLLGTDPELMMKAFCKPKIKVIMELHHPTVSLKIY